MLMCRTSFFFYHHDSFLDGTTCNAYDCRTILIIAVTVIIILLCFVEVILFREGNLATRTYLISQWAKATLMGAVWVTLVMLTFTQVWWGYMGNFAMTEFVFQQ